MNDAQEERMVLVKDFINPMFKFIDPEDFGIAKYIQDGSSERVEIRFRQGHVKSMDVTGLPLERVLRVVMRATFGL